MYGPASLRMYFLLIVQDVAVQYYVQHMDAYSLPLLGRIGGRRATGSTCADRSNSVRACAWSSSAVLSPVVLRSDSCAAGYAAYAIALTSSMFPGMEPTKDCLENIQEAMRTVKKKGFKFVMDFLGRDFPEGKCNLTFHMSPRKSPLLLSMKSWLVQ